MDERESCPFGVVVEETSLGGGGKRFVGGRGGRVVWLGACRKGGVEMQSEDGGGERSLVGGPKKCVWVEQLRGVVVGWQIL